MNNPTVDTSSLQELERKLEQLTDSKRKSILYSSLIKGAQVLMKATKSELKRQMGAAASRPVRSKSGQYPPLVNSIHISSKDKDYCEVKVTILRRGGGYLHWFEKGTEIRKTKAGANRGRIKELNFFKTARQSSENSMNDAIMKNVDEKLKKILD